MTNRPITEDMIIPGKRKNLGGFTVSRTLPNVKRRNVGPFVFVDHMGPLEVDEESALDVGPHPHIGLATVTYLFEGKGLHKDSLGSHQLIEPGDLNWMTSGSGIVHSERSPEEERSKTPKSKLHGIQVWVGLPVDYENCKPSFHHYDKSVMPCLNLGQGDELSAKLLIGSHSGQSSPVKTFSPTLFMEVKATKDNTNSLSFEAEEIGIFVISGEVQVNEQVVPADDLIVVSNPQKVDLKCSKKAHMIILGGEAFSEPRYIWWNFVSSKKETIREAAKKWEDQTMGKVPNEEGFIPLPKAPLP